MKIYEVIFKVTHKDKAVAPLSEVHYWSADSLAFAAQAAAEHADSIIKPVTELVSVKYALTVTKAVNEVTDDTTD